MSAHKIIVGYDRSSSAKAAASWALDEAERTGAPVEFFFGFEWPEWMPATSTIPITAVWPGGEIEREINGMMDEAVKIAHESHPTVRTTTSVAHAGTAATLIDRSAEAGMIVLGSRGHRAVTGLWENTAMVTRTIPAEERRPFDDLMNEWRTKSPDLEVSAEAVVEHPAAGSGSTGPSALVAGPGRAGR
jgi:nucleotide-binding universal stress UspA family protein